VFLPELLGETFRVRQGFVRERITGADLVMEIVNPDDPERDVHMKRRDYAEARIPEYWIVSPIDETIPVLTLTGDAYTEHGVFRRGQPADSVCLDGFVVSVAEVFDAA